MDTKLENLPQHYLLSYYLQLLSTTKRLKCEKISFKRQGYISFAFSSVVGIHKCYLIFIIDTKISEQKLI